VYQGIIGVCTGLLMFGKKMDARLLRVVAVRIDLLVFEMFSLCFFSVE